MLTVFGWGLDEEPGGDDVTLASRPRKHYVAELFFRAQLVEGGLLKELHRKLIEQFKLAIAESCFLAVLVVGEETGVLIGGVRDGKVESVELTSDRANVDRAHLSNVVNVGGLQT